MEVRIDTGVKSGRIIGIIFLEGGVKHISIFTNCLGRFFIAAIGDLFGLKVGHDILKFYAIEICNGLDYFAVLELHIPRVGAIVRFSVIGGGHAIPKHDGCLYRR
jgi:hypothetical protein